MRVYIIKQIETTNNIASTITSLAPTIATLANPRRRYAFVPSIEGCILGVTYAGLPTKAGAVIGELRRSTPPPKRDDVGGENPFGKSSVVRHKRGTRRCVVIDGGDLNTLKF
ncbi:hypothetical protein Trydic_g14542 [Trypoxylus dichotomus]